ncbi:hypothetical protein HYN43_008825 [Mucilaginibacter celer]|uniref:Uncharacterized protein n=1 Tax=Mucilaginibacter celer TaxID=2305508 RepID=A0A494VMQ0_9SPHI|nr:hypothetical protein HYN43_008825 [Mucilaginibacter celer]
MAVQAAGPISLNDGIQTQPKPVKHLIKDIHHISAIDPGPQENLDFNTGVICLKQPKKIVNLL